MTTALVDADEIRNQAEALAQLAGLRHAKGRDVLGRARNLTARLGDSAGPLLGLLHVVERFPTLSDHAIRRCAERRISLPDVYATVAHPDMVRSGKDARATATYVRGDIEVAADPSSGTIVTVIDRQSWHPEA